MYIVKDLGLILLLILLKHYRPKRYLAVDKPWFKLIIILILKVEYIQEQVKIVFMKKCAIQFNFFLFPFIYPEYFNYN
jgi:hypothetical protein